MSDVKAFVDTVGKDVTTVAVPRIEALAAGINDTVLNTYGPRVSAFANDLLKDIINDQSANVRDFVTALIQELCERYRPELVGDVRAHISQGGLDLTGQGVKLDLKRQDTGAVVASLDIPIAIRINVADLGLTLKDTTIKLDVVR
ncbi:MAG TPA: hypothetical protein VMS40_14620 [Vicinamibacterales bacterium]|nr:hypothetical protein [Vicinamibacterales bacterium]